jgi:hypothetical protein
MSGFSIENVGFSVGFLSLPDMRLSCRIIGLSAECRECRVFIGVETSQELAPALRFGGLE